MIQGVQGIGAEMAADHSDFHTFRSLIQNCVFILQQWLQFRKPHLCLLISIEG